MKENTLQFRRKRKALLVLPLVIVLFATIAFVALGGGKSTMAATTAKQQGLNTSLPGAQFDKHEKPKDKMSFYDQAKLDSARQQSNNNNPLVQQFGFKEQPAQATKPTSLYEDPNVTKINQRLADINKQISQPQVMPPAITASQPATNNKQLTEQVDRLEKLMKGTKTDSPDPEMQQISKMLEQLQAIQHPELVKPDRKDSAAANPFKAIAATIDGNQKIKQSSAVRLKLEDTVKINGQVIPKGTPVYGTANITNQRLLIEIKNIRLGEAIIPANLTVYAMDGMPGVPAPEAELSEAAGSGADNAMQSMQFLSMDASLATQAATGGINAAKSLFSKKVKRITVHLKNGSAVLLRNNQIH